MVADLTALTFEITPRGIKVESKDHVCDRLNRSTNKGDAVVQCWSQGQKHVIRVDVNSAEQGRYTRSTGKRPLVVDHGPRRPHGMNRR